ESTRSHLAYNAEILAVLGIVIAAAVLPSCHVSNKPPITNTLTLTSPAFPNDGRIPDKYTCAGQNVSPPLTWSGVPIDSAGVAIVVQDPDAPGGTFTHWIIASIDRGRTQLAEGERPSGAVEGVASDNQAHYV